MSDLPRLLLCCFDVVPAPTAISRRMTEYLKGMSERYQVVVLTVKTADHTHIERYHGARLLRVPVGNGDLASRVQVFDRAVRRQLESEEYVMVHFFDPFGGYALCERRAELGYKLVYDACSLPSVELPLLHDESEANRRFLAKVRRQELFCLMNADVVIVANELTRDFVTGLGVAREQVQVLPPPVDLAPYTPELMGTPDATPMRLVHLGNLSSAQDLVTVLEAMQLVLQTTDVRLVVVGPPHPEHQQRLEEQVVALKLSGKVEFQPPVPHDDLHKVLATADVGLLTLADIERNSRVGSPLSRLGEYLAAGRPVIAADVAAARAVLPEDGVVLYRPQDKQSLADAITSLATDPARRVKLGAAARAARLSFDAAKIRADLFATYHALTGTGVRAVGDADQVNPDEVTQLGRGLTEGDTSKQKLLRAPPREAPSGTNRVKTDPAIAGGDETAPEGRGVPRAPVMGVPIREEPPVVLGIEASDVVAELEQITTQPGATRPTEPPVVMGSPLVSPPGLAASVVDDGLATVSGTPVGPAEPEATASAAPPEFAPLVIPPLELPPFPPRTTAAPPRAAPPVLTPVDAPAVLAPPVLAPAPPVLAPAPPVLAPAPPVLAPAPPVLAPAPPVLAPAPQVLAPSRSPGSAPPVLTPVDAPALATATPVDSPAIAAPARPPALPSTRASGVFPVVPPRTSSGVFAAPGGDPPRGLGASAPPRTSSGIFVPPPLPADAPRSSSSGLTPVRTSSGVFPVVPAAPVRTSSGIFVPPALPPKPSTPLPPPLPRSGASGVFTPVAADEPSGLFPDPPQVPEGEAEAIDEHEIEPVGEDGPVEVSPDEIVEEAAPAHHHEEPQEMTAEDAAVMTVDGDASPPPSAIDPWLAQLVHGFCPPESGLFERHTPPTTMPGRDT